MYHLPSDKEPILARLTTNLTLAHDASIDLHMHTTYSDGRWHAEQLINYLVAEGFDMVSITDHDSVDTVASVQQLAAQQNLPVLAGVEMSTVWKGKGKMGHVLCYGFDSEHSHLKDVADKVVRRQLENTHEVYNRLLSKVYTFPHQEGILAANGGKPSRPADNSLLQRLMHVYKAPWQAVLRMIREAGSYLVLADMAETVDAAHRSGAVCLLAHPGRRERGFTFYDTTLLDQLRAEIPLDGLEVYHPSHSPEIINTYQEYVRKHNLLLSTGSDSHSIPGRMPIKYRAEISRELLERVGIHVRT
jgi:predicted metal-dependent phosphoesterase TrpH